MRLVDLCPYGVYPPRSGGHRLVHHTSLCLGDRHDVRVFSMGLRRFEGPRLRSFAQRPGGRYLEHRLIGPLTYASYLRRRRSGLPPLRASQLLRWSAPRALRRALAAADVVQVQCPWPFAFARERAAGPVVLVAQNAEAELLARRGVSARVLALARRIEGEALAQADAVIFLSPEDRAALGAAYGLSREGWHTCGVGVDTESFRPPSEAERAAAKAALGLSGPVALFAGSWHLPNRAAFAAVRALAAAAPEWSFLVVGSVGRPGETAERLRVTGTVEDVLPYFRAADVALNPMSEGSGVNLKVPEYLAMGLPTLSTPFGVRGLEVGDVVVVAELRHFREALDALRDPAERARRGGAARVAALARLRWEAVAERRERIYREVLERRAAG